MFFLNEENVHLTNNSTIHIGIYKASNSCKLQISYVPIWAQGFTAHQFHEDLIGSGKPLLTY